MERRRGRLANTVAYKAALTALYALLAWSAMMLFMTRPGMNGYYRATFPDMVRGTAWRPFAYRVLVPAVVRAVARATPDPVKTSVVSYCAGTGNEEHWWSRRLAGWRQSHIFEFLVVAAITFACYLWLAFLLRALLRHFYEVSAVGSDLLAAVGLLALPIFFVYRSYLYDPATVLLFTLGLLAVVRRQYALYGIAFVLATLNKETAFLLTGLFVLREFRDMPRKRLNAAVASQLIVWAAIQAWIRIAYASNPGSSVEFHFLDHNVGLLLEAGRLRWFLLVVTFAAIFAGRGWSGKPRFLRVGLLVVGGPLVCFGLLFGYLDEIRDYYETYALLFLLAAPTIAELVGLSAAPRAGLTFGGQASSERAEPPPGT